jgi:ParB family chromosome partitioning protein
MGSVISVSPFRCRVWKLHDRLEELINEKSCKDEIESFQEHGQLVPVMGRRVMEEGFDVELIYGARRLFVARHINAALLVEMRDISDRDAIVAMDIENRQRKDISPYERGLSYARWLRAGYFESQDEVARALKVSASQVSRLLTLARLPSVVVDAFGCPGEICEGWGLGLAEALEQPERRKSTIQAAREIAAVSPRPHSKEVYRQLLASSVPGRKLKQASHDKVVRGKDGLPLFRIKYRRDSVALILPIEKVSAKSLESIESAIANVLQDSPQKHRLAVGLGDENVANAC